MLNMKKSLIEPWWIKIIAKIVLSRLPFSYSIWQKIGFFRHGKMDQVSYVKNVFDHHTDVGGLTSQIKEKTILELGPGDSIATAIIAACHGAKTILIDSGDYALKNIGYYQNFSKELSKSGLSPPDLSKAQNRKDILDICNAVYLTAGLASLKSLEKGSVDFIFSQAVLEHVRRHEFAYIMSEFHRVLKTNGTTSHKVDLKDHLGGGLNNMRFSHSIWESKFFARSGFYTNRIRFSEMILILRNAGFEVEILNERRWSSCPIQRKSLSKDFSNVTNEDLLISGFDVLMKPITMKGN